MDKKTKENLLFAIEEDWTRFKKPILLVLSVGIVWFAVYSVFHTIDQALSAVEIEGYAPHPKEESPVVHVSQETKIFIPRIGVEAPILFVNSTAPRDFLAPLKEGVVHYPSPAPGEKGAAIILGHSAPLDIFKQGFNGVFTELKHLESGDEIFIQYQGSMHTYVVEKQEVLQRGQDIPQELVAATESKLLLLSCWPPGIDNKRIMVQATAL